MRIVHTSVRGIPTTMRCWSQRGETLCQRQATRHARTQRERKQCRSRKHIELADEAHAHKAPIVARDWFLLAVSAGDLRKRQRRDKSEENGLVQKTLHKLTHPPGARPGAALRARGTRAFIACGTIQRRSRQRSAREAWRAATGAHGKRGARPQERTGSVARGRRDSAVNRRTP